MDPPPNNLRINFPPWTNSTKNAKRHNKTPSHPIPAPTSTILPSPLITPLATPQHTPVPTAHRHPKLPTPHFTPGAATRRKPLSWEGAAAKTAGATYLASTYVASSAEPPRQPTPALVRPARRTPGRHSSHRARTTGPVGCLRPRPY